MDCKIGGPDLDTVSYPHSVVLGGSAKYPPFAVESAMFTSVGSRSIWRRLTGIARYLSSIRGSDSEQDGEFLRLCRHRVSHGDRLTGDRSDIYRCEKAAVQRGDSPTHGKPIPPREASLQVSPVFSHARPQDISGAAVTSWRLDNSWPRGRLESVETESHGREAIWRPRRLRRPFRGVMMKSDRMAA